MNIYDFSVKDKLGNDVKLSEYEGKALLIVNTATECGFTPQYSELQYIYEKYKQKGLEILDFPCNDFGAQAPGTDDEILFLCKSRFNITFRQFHKITTKGVEAEPLFKWLEDNTKFEGFDKLHPLGQLLETSLKNMDPNFDKKSNIKWNFTKFLIDRNGNIAKRFEPTTQMVDIENAIDALIAQK